MLGAGLSLLLFAAAPMDLGLMQRAWLLVHSLLLAGVPYLAVTTAGRGEVKPVASAANAPEPSAPPQAEADVAEPVNHSAAGSSHRHRASHRRSVPD